VSYVNAIDVVTVNLVTGVVTGPDGADTLIGIEGVIGGAYNDVFTGNGLDNVLDGQGGYDELNGGAGNDTLLGGTSDDILRGDAGNDTLDGQGGTGDLASWFNDPGGVTADLLSGTATDGYGNTDTLLRVEWLSGANGYSNTLSGDNGANTINAWSGADRITGRGGADILQGGTNADRFVYLATTDAPVGETITDFVSGSGDLVDLSAIDPSAAAGDQAFAFIGTGTFSGTGTAQVRFSGGTVQADSNGDGIADMTISMTGVVAMVAGDFVL
jgi:Ca2+-binding RTX toxin-like protein